MVVIVFSQLDAATPQRIVAGGLFFSVINRNVFEMTEKN